MGADKPKFALPQATETDSATGVSTDVGTQVTEKTSYTLQEGNAVTIPTKHRRKHKEADGPSSSRASLLIEYFQGGAGSHVDSKPSVRVKVQRPSSKSRSRNDFVEITESKSTRRPSYTKRIQLEAPKSPERDGDDHSLNSYRSATEESNVTSRTGGPIEIEVVPRRHGSPLIPTGESSSKYITTASDISSMPADSFLDNTRSTERTEKVTPTRRRSRSLSRERLVVQKVAEKVREEKPERRRKHRSRSRSVSGEQIKSPRRRSNYESTLGAESSILSSNVSSNKSSSINNPKLLEMVETTIKRLILPELEALKRENSKHQQRRSSVTSGSAISRDSRDDASSTRRYSERESGTDVSGKPRVVLNDSEVLSGKSTKVRKDKNLDRVKLTDSPRSFERETSEDTVVQDDRVRKKRSSDHRGLKTAAVAAGVSALTAAALEKHESQESLDEKKERRRRRTKSRSRSESLGESYEERRLEVPPPLPLMSDINASEITRTSILSAETDRPHSASQERHVTPLREVSRGVVSPASRTPTRTPVALQQGLGTQHSNYSRGNLSLHSQHSETQLRSQEYELDEHGRKIPMNSSPEEEYEDSFVEEEHVGSTSRALPMGATGAAAGAALSSTLHNRNLSNESDLQDDEEEFRYYQDNQEVPPPLKYVPYAAQRRGLSPIQSVSGYTEGDPDVHHRDSRLTHSTGSYSSLNKSYRHDQMGRSIRSADSLGNVRNRHDFAEVRQGGLTDSEVTQDGEYWEEQHRENERLRDGDTESYRSFDPRMDYKHMANYANDSVDGSELDRVATGQNIRGVGANPDYVHTPLAVESAVASLVNASELTGSGLSPNTGHFDRRGSYASFDGGEEKNFTSRGNSPQKSSLQRELSYEQSDRASSRRDSPEKYEEYELDKHGRKVAIPETKSSHTAAKAGLAGIAAGAAAAVLAGRNKKSDSNSIHSENREEFIEEPVNKSFKQRALEGHGQIPSPRHSVDALSLASSHEQLKMGASGIPDLSNPIPEIGYGDDQSDITNSSSLRRPASAQQLEREHWSGHSTPTKSRLAGTPIRDQQSDANLKAAEAALIGAAAAAGGAAAVASHSRNNSYDDDWPRTSKEHKRDTIITNPYEDTSPIAAIGNGLDQDLLVQPGYPGPGNSFSPAGYQAGRLASPKDEGYISSAPNNARSPGAVTPERRTKGVGFLDQDLSDATNALGGGDPFYTPKHSRHLSGMSHGMDSPVYDSATGNGIDRIQSKDIIALMDHLTVRDAQRSARDTEILVTLVRAAAEMRNSFEDMKRLLADTEDVIITEVQTNTEKSVQKVINGPRPLPPSAPRSIRQGSQDDMYDDIPSKRRNVFRRALKGLSMRSTNDLGKIEEMLVQLLGEVEGLKVAQGLKPDSSHRGESFDDLRQEGNYENDRGYEPEGHAGTSTASHASQSGHLSIPTTRGFDGRKFSDHRISTVPEGDEDELDQHEQEILSNQFEHNEALLTPTREITRSDSVPLGTSPQNQVAAASHSVENTPKTDKSKKHKSSSSSGWIPKVSRWSETTASTVLRGFRSSGRGSGKKGDDQFEPPSRSGSDLANYAEHDHDPYGEDRLHGSYSQDQINEYQESDPALVLPPEDPKYKAHRDSLNLQHPQPRPGPTHRYQTALEHQAQDFDSPMSPRSAEWGASQTSLNRLPPQQTNRYSNTTNNTHPGNMSPVSDGAYSTPGPARPPKEPLGPERPPKLKSSNGKLQKPSPLSNEHLIDDDRYSQSYDQPNSPSSPRSAPRVMSGNLSGVPIRKPTGPRSMSSASRSGELKHELQNKDSGTNLKHFIL